MFIVIKDPEPTVEVSFETKVAPCPGCKFFKRSDSAVLCDVEGRGLSAAVIRDCKRFEWRQEL